jgi:hypothetical protein|tara:strand:+ start:40509 stop:41276 length:768 start_codon:yes stop_codon:yes gene_type:complete
MNRFFELIDKNKFGIIAAFAAYILIFVYLQMRSYTEYFPITPFHEGASIQKEPEIELDKEQIEVPQDFQSNVKNMARDQNDDRERSMDKYSQNKPSESASQSVKDYEKKLFEETGGAAERERIKQQMEKAKQDNASKSTTKTTKPAQTGGDKAFAGNVMVEWSLTGRDPHQKNNWNVRNPGYTCGVGSNGTVVIDIRVNQNGDVISATYNSGSSYGTNPCMIEQAQKYAKMSRFAFSSSAPKSQDGTIIYRFVSQ